MLTHVVYNKHMKSKHIILGLIGQPSGGKDTVADYIVKKYEFVHVSTGDMLREYITKHNLGKTTRDVMQVVSTRLREQYGANYLVTQAIQHHPNKNIIISGLRNPAEAQEIHKAGGELLTVNSSLETRYVRAKSRGRVGDEIDFDTFCKQEKLEENNSDPNAQNLNAVLLMADEFIDNDDNLEALYTKVDAYMRRLTKKSK